MPARPHRSCVHSQELCASCTPRRPGQVRRAAGWLDVTTSGAGPVVEGDQVASDRTSSTGRQADPGRVLCLVDEPDLRARLLAACREVAVSPDVRAGPPEPAAWSTASLVLLDARSAEAVAVLPRRSGVVLVHHDPHGGDPGSEVWRLAVAAGAEHVVVLPGGAGWLGELLVRSVRPGGRCVAVVGARGGAGATTTAIALATAAAATGRRVVLVDGDPLGAGVDLAMGAEELPGLRWHDLHDVRAPLPPGGLAAALPVADGVSVLAWGRGPAPEPRAVRAVVRAALDEHDLVVLDLPRAGEAAASAAVTAPTCCCASARASCGLSPRRPPCCAGGARPPSCTCWSAGRLRAGWAGTTRGPPWPPAWVPHQGGLVPTSLSRVDVVRAEPGLAAALERGEAFAVGPRSPLRRWARRWLVEELPVGQVRAA
jgi:secretion/DNA translocation related CpaE-like protein